MPRPKRYLYWKNEKERIADRMLAWETKRLLVSSAETPAHVRLAASEEMLNRIDGKVADRLADADGENLSVHFLPLINVNVEKDHDTLGTDDIEVDFGGNNGKNGNGNHSA